MRTILKICLNILTRLSTKNHPDNCTDFNTNDVCEEEEALINHSINTDKDPLLRYRAA